MASSSARSSGGTRSLGNVLQFAYQGRDPALRRGLDDARERAAASGEPGPWNRLAFEPADDDDHA